MAQPLWGGGAGTNGNTTSYSVSVTPANNNRVLYAFLLAADTTGPTSVVFNTSETMTSIANGTLGGGARGWWLYRLIAPSATTANVTATFASGAARKLTGFWYYDVDQTTPNDSPDAVTGTGTTVQNTVSSATGDTVVGLVSHVASSTHTEASGETERLDPSTGDSAIYELAGAATVSFDVTLGTSRDWVCVGINLKALSGTTHNAIAALAGAATVGLAARLTAAGAAALAGSATVALAAGLRRPGAAALAAAATITPAATAYRGGVAALAGSAAISPAGRATYAAAATLPGSAAVSLVSRVTRPAAAALSGAATQAATGVLRHGAVAALAGTGHMDAVPYNELFPQERSNATTAGGIATTHNVNLPATIEAGDLLIMYIAIDGAEAITSPPSGWTQLYDVANGTAVRHAAFWKRAVGNEDAGTEAVTIANSDNIAAAVVAYEGAGDPEAGTAATGSSENPDPPSLTPAGGAKDYLWIAAVGTDAGDGDVQSAPSGYLGLIAVDGTGINLGVARKELNASSDNPGTFDLLDTNAYVANTIAIPPGGETHDAAAALPGAATLAAAVVLFRPGAAAFAGAATMAAAQRLTASGAAVLAGVGTITPAARKTAAGAATLAGAGTIAAAGGVTLKGILAVTGVATIAADARSTFADASLLGSATITPAARATYAVVAAFTGTGAVSGAAGLRRPGASALTAAATLAAVGGHSLLAQAAFIGAAAQAAAPRFTLGATALLAGIATITPNGSLQLSDIDFTKTAGRIWAVVKDTDGTTPLGILPLILEAETYREIDRLGSFFLRMPEEHPSAALVEYGRYVDIYREGIGLRFPGMIESRQTEPSEDFMGILRVEGSSLAAELVYENTYTGHTYDDDTLADSIDKVLSELPAWTKLISGTGYNNISARFEYKSLFETAVSMGRIAGGFTRETTTERELEIRNTFADSGLIFTNLEGHGPTPPAVDSNIVPIAGIPDHLMDGRTIYNRVIPFGRAVGVDNLTLRDSTRTTPWTIQQRTKNRPKVTAWNDETTAVASDEPFPKNWTACDVTVDVTGVNRHVLVFVATTHPAFTGFDTLGIPTLYAYHGTRRLNALGRMNDPAEIDNGSIGMFSYPEAPAGKVTITVYAIKPFATPADDVDVRVMAVALENVEQSANPIANASIDVAPYVYELTSGTTEGTGTGPTTNVASDTDDLVVSFIWRNANTSIDGADQTSMEDYNSGIRISASYENGASPTKTASYTLSSSTLYRMMAVSLRPAVTYYLENATSIAAHGGIPRVKILNNLDLTALATSSPVALANALYDAAAAFLNTHGDEAHFYGVPIHYLPDAYVDVLPGDSARLLYKGLVEEDDGKRIWKAIDDTVILIGIRETMTEGQTRWEFVLGTAMREAPGAQAEIGALAGDVTALKAASTTIGAGGSPG